MTNKGLDSQVAKVDPSEVTRWNKRTTRIRAVEPIIEFLGWPLRNPNSRTRVNLDEQINGSEADYALYKDGELKLVVDVLPELEDFNLHKQPIEKTDWYISCDGYNYQLNVKTKNHLRKVEEFTLDSISEKNNVLNVVGIEGVESELIDSVFDQYRMLEEDRTKLESKVTEGIITDSVDDEFQTLRGEEVREGSVRMADFLLRKIEDKSFNNMVENAENRHEEEMMEIDAGKLVIVVKETEDNIETHFKRENPTGRIVTYSTDKPDYIAFYTKENNRIEYVAGVDSFDLVENREEGEFADKVFNIELSNVRELQNYIEDPSDDLMPIEYCKSQDLIASKTTKNIEFMDK